MKKSILFLLTFIASLISSAQPGPPVFYKGATKEKRAIMQRNILQNTITKNLSLPLTDGTEDNWADAFWGMELIRYKSPWADGRISTAFDSIEKRSAGFQRALLELAYTNYPGRFIKQATYLLNQCNDAKVFAMCAEYLLLSNKEPFAGININNQMRPLVTNPQAEAITGQLWYRIQNQYKPNSKKIIGTIITPGFLKGQIILYSFQRKNRNYPGLALVRDSTGNFITDSNGVVFSVPQLARSISNLPGYLTNGNTPQGIFRMYGFDTSKTTFIGPTANIQLTMPFETSLQHFFQRQHHHRHHLDGGLV